jgi:hypothetical protein
MNNARRFMRSNNGIVIMQSTNALVIMLSTNVLGLMQSTYCSSGSYNQTVDHAEKKESSRLLLHAMAIQIDCQINIFTESPAESSRFVLV